MPIATQQQDANISTPQMRAQYIFQAKEATREEIQSDRFEVLHVAYGSFPRGYVFSRAQLKDACPMPTKANPKLMTHDQYLDKILARALSCQGGTQGPAIRVTKLPISKELQSVVGGGDNMFPPNVDMTQKELEIAVRAGPTSEPAATTA